MNLPQLIMGSAAGHVVDDLVTLIEKGVRFGTIYADPPWRFKRKPRGAAEKHYRTMSLDEIISLPIGELSAPEAHLHLWVPHSFLFDAKRVMDAWGFEYKGLFVWLKPRPGLGHYWRSRPNTCSSEPVANARFVTSQSQTGFALTAANIGEA